MRTTRARTARMSMSSSMMTHVLLGMKSSPVRFSPIDAAHAAFIANSALPDQRAQILGIDDLNRLAFDAQQPFDLEARQEATYGLQPKPEIAADVGAAQ